VVIVGHREVALNRCVGLQKRVGADLILVPTQPGGRTLGEWRELEGGPLPPLPPASWSLAVATHPILTD
jgi:hypothetical protein